MFRNILIGCIIAINMFSIDFFYSVDKQSKNIGFCGTSYNETQESDNVSPLLYSSENSIDKKFIKNSGNDNLKEVYIDISEFKNTVSNFQMPDSQLQSAYITNDNLKIPDNLITYRLFKPPKITC